MARSRWFDPETSEMNFMLYMEQMESWQQALADGVVEPEELRQQSERVAELLRALEPKLNEELHEEVTNILYEMAVLYGMAQLADMTLNE
ncbi:MAG: hypothetical protein A2Y73_04120 [Chloroflexi bacterium RBG_13_56_8]|nr:MAG: hypothetical protein A2Y73_04120 [Chloroflexi bacterium RBG_13_56_8]